MHIGHALAHITQAMAARNPVAGMARKRISVMGHLLMRATHHEADRAATRFLISISPLNSHPGASRDPLNRFSESCTL